MFIFLEIWVKIAHTSSFSNVDIFADKSKERFFSDLKKPLFFSNYWWPKNEFLMWSQNKRPFIRNVNIFYIWIYGQKRELKKKSSVDIIGDVGKKKIFSKWSQENRHFSRNVYIFGYMAKKRPIIRNVNIFGNMGKKRFSKWTQNKINFLWNVAILGHMDNKISKKKRIYGLFSKWYY